MRLVNLDRIIKDFDGNEVKMTPSPDSPSLTIKKALESLCMLGYQQKTPTADSVALIHLGQSIHDAKDELDVNAEEVTLLGKIIDANMMEFKPLVTKAIYEDTGLGKKEKK